MKKAVTLSAALVLSVSGVSSVMAAPTAEPTMSPQAKSKLTVASEKSSTVSLVNETYDKESVSIKNVLKIVNSLNAVNASEKQSFEVTSISNNGRPVDVYLRVSTESSALNALYDSQKLIDTYNITIKNGDNVVYSSKNSSLKVSSPKKNEYVIDIPLKRFNESEAEEINNFDIEISIPVGKTVSQIKNAKKLDWEIVSDPVEEGAAEFPTIVPSATPTATPVATTVTSSTVNPTMIPAPTELVSESATQVPATTPPAATKEPSKTIKYVGEGKDEIKPGTYTITAKDKEAVVRIFNKDGELEKEIEINEKKPSQVVTLKDGQSIMNDGGVNLKTYISPTAAPNATKNTSSTGTKSGAASSSSSSKNAKATATAKPSKANPKTGDSAPIAGAAALGVFALGMMAYPSLEKRRKDNE